MFSFSFFRFIQKKHERKRQKKRGRKAERTDWCREEEKRMSHALGGDPKELGLLTMGGIIEKLQQEGQGAAGGE